MRLTLLLSLGLFTLTASAGLADEPAKTHDPRAAFTEADENHDGRIDREEFHHRVVEVFYHGDRDKDGYLTLEELKVAVVFPDDFDDADRNSDDRISLYEFVQVRFATFDEVDEDDDGLLSVEEVVDAYEVRD
jgi:Ca2+-binding EF-hand superfamily protein